MYKTGSTSIQAALQGYKDEKFEYAVLPPAIEKDVPGAFDFSLLIDVIFRAEYKNFPQLESRGVGDSEVDEMRVRYRKIFSDSLRNSDADVVVISAETIVDLDFEATQNFVDFLRDHAQEIQVLAYVRSPFDFIKSATQEVFKGRHIGDQMHGLSYRHYFEALEAAVGLANVSYRVFERDGLKDGDVVSDFWSWVGFTKERKCFAEANQSLSTDAARCMAALHGGQIQVRGSQLLHSAREAMFNTLMEIFPGRFEIPNHLVAKNVDIWDLTWMEKRLGRRLNSPPHTDEHLDVLSFKD